jgi:hypothetical protein
VNALRGLAILATLAALAAVLLGMVSPLEMVRIYLLGVIAVGGSIVASKTLSRFGRVERSAFRRQPAEESAAPFFERAERRIELANASGVYFEQLRPRLREIAEQRLAGRGLRLRSAEARDLLGDEAWLALERPPQGDKFESPEPGRLGRVIAALEGI